MTNSVTETDDAPTRPKRSVGRIIGITAYGVVAGIVVIALIAAGFVVFTIQRSFPQLDGTIAVEGLGDDVTVERDALGIPVITADDSHDLFFAQGYVHAQDRFWEMDFRRHVTSGRVSELFGESQLATDAFLRTLGWREIAEQEVEALDDASRAYYEAYADGVNAYLAEHRGADASFEYAVLGLQNDDYEIEPWTPADSVAWLKAMAWDLRSNLEEESSRALLATGFDGEQIADLFPDYPFDRNPVIVPQISSVPALGTAADAEDSDATTAPASIEWTEVDGVVEAVGALVGDTGEGIGSNSWVVSGDLTETGMPLLANDPHLGAALPSVWHQSALKCRVVSADCAFDVAGFGFAGVPGVIIGHNDRIAWGFTNLTSDVADLYIEKIEGDEYWRDGELVPLEERTETLKVAGGDDVELVVRSTVHGPIVSGLTDDYTDIAEDPRVIDGRTPGDAPDGEYAVSLRWTALEVGTTASAVFALNVAQDFDGFRQAAALFEVPAQNLLYADVDGNIGYQAPGSLPIRGAGDGWMPQPGWDSAYDWQGFIPFEDLPVVYNPDEGYIVTANNAVVDADYEYFLTRDWDYGWRAARIVDLIERKAAAAPLTIDDMRDIQADNEFFIGRRLVAAYADIETGRQGPDAALDQLREWHAQNDADSGVAAYANVVWDELVQNLFVRGRDEEGPVTDQARLFLLVDELLADPTSEWWNNPELDVSSRDEMLALTASDAYDRLVSVQGDNPARWSWGALHALPLRSDTFGSSGIAPIEMLFNRGPYPVGGGSSVVNATGWDIG
ncbi:MAG: penicillin acylase family protein, partial [Microbacterium sp.]